MPVTNSSSGIKPGFLAAFAASSAPAGWIKANGAAVSRTLYAALFANIGTTHGAGDGVTTFNVPDCRGEFIRGLDDGRGVDAGRVIGSAQAQGIQTHNHSYTTCIAATSGVGSTQSVGYPGAGTTGSVGGSETRPRNVAHLVCIKI